MNVFSKRKINSFQKGSKYVKVKDLQTETKATTQTDAVADPCRDKK